MVNRLLEEETVEAEALPSTVQSLLAARLDSLDRLERRLLQSASVVGQTFWEGALATTAAEEGLDLGRTLSNLEEKDLLVPSAGSRLAGEREYAFKHVLIRDVAYSMLPKSVRCRKHVEVAEFIRERAGERSDGVIGLIAEHFARAAALGSEAGLERDALAELQTQALESLEAAGDAAAALYSNAEAFDRYTAALEISESLDPGTVARIGEKQGDVALRMGRVDAAVAVWERCLDYHRAQEDLARVADLHRKIGAALWHKGERRASIDNYQRGIDLLKDGPPCIELVRLYEEAASLYMHTGDNMLAIYASEKALRLAERLDEARAASRAHGIFGRVFGRIGDSEKARENLERSVALARESDRAEAVRALLTLGLPPRGLRGRLRRRGDRLPRGARDRAGGRRPALAGRAPRLARRARRRQRRLGGGRGGRRGERQPRRARGPLRQALLPGPDARRAQLARRGLGGGGPVVPPGARARRAGRALRGRVQRALLARDHPARERRPLRPPRPSSTRALDICERAGLIAQSVEAISARAVVLALAGRTDQARAAAEEADRLAGRLHYPVGEAATAEAAGACADDAEEAAAKIDEARSRWLELGRPLDATRCLVVQGRLLLGHDPETAAQLLDDAAAEYEELGAPALAARAARPSPPAPYNRAMSEDGPKTWILTGSLENFRINVERGFDVVGFKERRRRQAEEFEPGDEIVFYVTGVQAFGGIARVKSEMFEDRAPNLAPGAKKADRPRSIRGASRPSRSWSCRRRTSSPPRSWSPSSSTSASGRSTTGTSPSRGSSGRSATRTPPCSASASPPKLARA